ncbi:hypothetical protein [Nostoc sp.]|uniref:hypothetical protein n=1 Tax=Nostoc sp. TaxID=1180 RepID=UPI002FF574EB
MLNQRVLAGLLAVTTATITVAGNVSPSYGNNSTNVQYLAQGRNLTWVEVFDYANKGIDLARKINDLDLVGKFQKLSQVAKGWVDQNLGKETATKNTVDDLTSAVQSLNSSDFTTPEMKQKLQDLKDGAL